MLPEAEAMTAYDPGEREELERVIAERDAEIRKAELLAWCEQRNAAREEERHAAETITKSATTTRRAQAMNDTAGWQAYIAREIERANKDWIEAAMSAVGIKLKELRAEAQAEREKMRAEFELEIARLRAEFLQIQLDEERGVKRSPLKVVPPAMIA
jgi:LPS O-antigen subunit length determinant protein (WzzB/FepE family)